MVDDLRIVEGCDQKDPTPKDQIHDLEHYDVYLDGCCCCCCSGSCFKCFNGEPRTFKNTKPNLFIQIVTSIPFLFVIITSAFVTSYLLYFKDNINKYFIGVCIGYGILMLIFVFWLGFVVYLCYPRAFLGKRKFTKAHDLSLHKVLVSNYQYIPSVMDLSDIDLKTRNNFLIRVIKVLETNAGFEDLEMFLAGSSSERFCIPLTSETVDSGILCIDHALLSDLDYMVSPSTKIASFNENEEFYFVKATASGEEAPLMPGFVYIFENEYHTLLSAKSIKEKVIETIERIRLALFSDDSRTVSVHFCCCTRDINNKTGQVNIKGPAIEFRIGKLQMLTNFLYADMTFALKCSEWPTQANNWLRREKKWPSQNEVNRIMNLGCHLVPKSQEGDEEAGKTWRISFSKAEVELSKIVPNIARACLVGIKIIAKDYLSVISSKISTYKLKTIFYYCLENTEPDIWSQESNTELCFEIIIEAVIDALRQQWCPHFWIPSINLFSDLTVKEANQLFCKLQKIRQDPKLYIEQYVLSKEQLREIREKRKEELEEQQKEEERLNGIRRRSSYSSDEELWEAILKAGQRSHDAFV